MPGTVASSFGDDEPGDFSGDQESGLYFQAIHGYLGYISAKFYDLGRCVALRGGYFERRRLGSPSAHAGKAKGFLHECQHAHKI